MSDLGGDGGRYDPAQSSTVAAEPASRNAENGSGSVNQQEKKLVISDEYFQKAVRSNCTKARQLISRSFIDSRGGLQSMRSLEGIFRYTVDDFPCSSFYGLAEGYQVAMLHPSG